MKSFRIPAACVVQVGQVPHKERKKAKKGREKERWSRQEKLQRHAQEPGMAFAAMNVCLSRQAIQKFMAVFATHSC